MRKIVWGIAALLLATAPTAAAEIKAFVVTAMQPALAELIPAFERTTGHKVSIVTGGSDALSARLRKREFADMILAGKNEILLLAKEGKVKQAVDVAATGFGIAMKKGAPHPDVSTPEALKRALLAAKSIAQASLSAGVPALHVQRVLSQLGIREQVSGRLVFGRGSNNVSALVARGEADIGIDVLSDLMSNPDVEVIGPLPGRLQMTTVEAAAVTTVAKEADGARALVEHLSGPEAQALYKAKGLGL